MKLVSVPPMHSCKQGRPRSSLSEALGIVQLLETHSTCIFVVVELNMVFRKTWGQNHGCSVSTYWDHRITSFCSPVADAAMVFGITPPGSLPMGCSMPACEGGQVKLHIYSLTVGITSLSGTEKYPEMPKIWLNWRVRSPAVRFPRIARAFLQFTHFLFIPCF